MAATLFFYGSLRERPLLAAVTGRGVEGLVFRAARAPGFRVVHYPGRVYPARAAAAAGEAAPGVAVSGLSDADVAALDVYEGNEYVRQPIALEIGGEPAVAEVYRPTIAIPEDALPWDYETFCRIHGAALDLGTGQTPEALRVQLENLKPGSGEQDGGG
jgi:hypothetical protein